MANMRQIAEEAGVSRGTVDRVLNGRGRVSAETEERVRKAVERLNYVPSQVSRELSSAKRNLRLTFILFDPNCAVFFAELEKGAHRECEELRRLKIEVSVRYVQEWKASAFLSQLDSALAEGTDGIAITGINLPELAARLRTITASGIPVVVVNSNVPDCGQLAFVGSDAFRAGIAASAVVHMIQREPVRLGAVIGFRSSECHIRRWEGFQYGLKRLRIPYEVVYYESNNDDEFEAYDIVRGNIYLHPEVNTLFLATGSGVFGACRALEKLPPERRPKVVCYDAAPWTRIMIRRRVISASILQDPELQGREALRILVAFLTTGTRPASPTFYTENALLTNENLPPLDTESFHSNYWRV